MNPALFREHLETMKALKNTDAFIAHVSTLPEPLTAHQFIVRLNTMSSFWNHEEKKAASNSFLHRKIKEGSILFNGERMEPEELIDFPLFSLVMFPKSDAKRCTLV